MLFITPLLSSAEEKGFLDALLGKRVVECKSHFDIEPYLLIAVGADQNESVDANFAASVKTLIETWHLKLRNVSGVSVGVGARIVLPKLYRFVLRLDYAVPLVKSDEMNFSFGIQQFF